MEGLDPVEGIVEIADVQTAKIRVRDEIILDKLFGVKTMGREPDTAAEAERRKLIMRSMLGTVNLADSHLVEGLWLDTEGEHISQQSQQSTTSPHPTRIMQNSPHLCR